MKPTYTKDEIINSINVIDDSLEGFESLYDLLMEEITWYEKTEAYQILNHFRNNNSENTLIKWKKDIFWFSDKISDLNTQLLKR